MFIGVGSTNPVKISAVKAAFNRFFPTQMCKVEGFPVSSEVSDQPIGFEEILQGAHNRATNAQQHNLINSKKNSNPRVPDYCVGIEAGFVPIPNHRYLDYQFCVILDKAGDVGIGSGSGLMFPAAVVEQLVKNREIELADVMAKISGNSNIKHEEGAIGFYSQGKITRKDITQQGVEMAILPFLNREAYFPSSTE